MRVVVLGLMVVAILLMVMRLVMRVAIRSSCVAVAVATAAVGSRSFGGCKASCDLHRDSSRVAIVPCARLGDLK